MQDNDLGLREVTEILTAKFSRFGLDVNVEAAITNSRRAIDGRKVIKNRYAPLLKFTKRGNKYFYNAYDTQIFIDEMVEYYDQEKLTIPYHRVTNMSAEEYLDVWDDYQIIELQGGLQMYVGTLDGHATILVTKGEKTYLLKTKGGEQ